MPAMTTKKCKFCESQFEVRCSDVSRGKGIYCSRSCKSRDIPSNNLPKPPNGKDHRLWRGGKAATQRRRREYKVKHHDRVNAHRAVYFAKRRGTLVQMPCETCGEVKSEAHHDDYSKPLNVRWLCRKHHREADKKLGIGMRDFGS